MAKSLKGGLLVCEQIDEPHDVWLGLFLSENQTIWLSVPERYRIRLGRTEDVSSLVRNKGSEFLISGFSFNNTWKYRFISKEEAR